MRDQDGHLRLARRPLELAVGGEGAAVLSADGPHNGFALRPALALSDAELVNVAFFVRQALYALAGVYSWKYIVLVPCTAHLRITDWSNKNKN